MPSRPTIPVVPGVLHLVFVLALSPVRAQEAPPPADSAGVADIRVAIEALRVDIAEVRAEMAELRVEFREGRTEIEQSAKADTASAAAVKENLKEAKDQVSGLIWMVAQSLLLILFIYYTVNAIAWLLERLSERDARRRLLFKRLVPITRISLWILAVFVIVDVIFEVSRDQLFAASAAVGVAIGFASQDVLKNIFGGLIIILDKPFQVGDKISVGGTYGEVISIGLRATRIQTPDDSLVSVPNAQVVDGQVSNANSGNLDCQVVTDLFLPGWVDVMRAKQIAYEAAANSQYVFLEKPIVVGVRDEFRETFLTHLKVKAYVIDTRFEYRLSSDITETAKTQFRKEGMLSPMEIESVSQSHLADHIND